METKRLAKHGLVYSLTSILTQAISMLMVPLFTRYMSQDTYGQYNLLISVQSLLAIFITLGIFSGMTRFINEFEDKNRTKNITLTFSLFWGGLMWLLSWIYGEFICQMVLPSVKNGGYYINYIVGSSFLLCLISVYNSYFTMLFKSKCVGIINLSRAFFILLYSAYFIIIRQGDLTGALEAQLLALATVLTGLILYDFKRIGFVFAWNEFKLMLKYSLGLVPGQAAAWVYTLIDRYFIQAILGLQQVAVYAIGYRLGMMLEPMFLVPFKAVFTSYKYTVYKEVDAPEKIRNIYQFYNFIGWFCLLGFSVFAKPAIVLLATMDYLEAFKVVPLIVFSYFLSGLGEFYSLGIHIKNKSMIDSYILAIGAVINILLNVWLIRVFGIMGAAIATVLSYLSMNILYFLIGKKYLELGLNYFAPLKGGIVFLLLYGFYLLVISLFDNIFFEMVISALLCFLYLFLGILIGLIPRELAQSAIPQLIQRTCLGKDSEKS